jgi:hypothetical protein
MIGREVPLQDGADGVGYLYIFLKEQGIPELDVPEPFRMRMLADFSDGAELVSFSLSGVVPSPRAFEVIAIFDDDISGLPMELGPGTGDLLATDGGEKISIVINEALVYELDLVLSATAP